MAIAIPVTSKRQSQREKQPEVSIKINCLLKLILKVLDKPTVIFSCQTYQRRLKNTDHTLSINQASDGYKQWHQQYFEVEDTSKNPPYLEFLYDLLPDLQSFICVPMQDNNGTVIGSIWVLDCKKGKIESWKKISLQKIANEIKNEIIQDTLQSFCTVENQNLTTQPIEEVLKLVIRKPDCQKSSQSDFHRNNIMNSPSYNDYKINRLSLKKSYEQNFGQLNFIIRKLENKIIHRKSPKSHTNYFPLAS